MLKVVNAILSIYIEFFRGTPMIVQAMVIYYGLALAFGMDMDRMLQPSLLYPLIQVHTWLKLFAGELFPLIKDNLKRHMPLGMNHFQTMMNVVLPQTFRNILPATGNQFVINIKDTSVLNVISVSELFFQTNSIAGNNFRYFESFFVASLLYLVMTFTVTRIITLC